MPKGYWIVAIDCIDPVKYLQLREISEDALDRLAGTVIVQTARGEIANGSFRERVVVVEFPTYADAVDAYDDPQYRSVRDVLEPYVDYDLKIVPGAEH